MAISNLSPRRWWELKLLEAHGRHELLSLTPNDTVMTVWDGRIAGPCGSPYENGIFVLRISTPEGYPSEKPVIHFLTKIWHVNVCPDSGKVLLSEWSSDYSLLQAVDQIIHILKCPNQEQFINVIAGHQSKQSMSVYEETARISTHLHAADTGHGPDATLKEKYNQLMREACINFPGNSLMLDLEEKINIQDAYLPSDHTAKSTLPAPSFYQNCQIPRSLIQPDDAANTSSLLFPRRFWSHDAPGPGTCRTVPVHPGSPEYASIAAYFAKSMPVELLQDVQRVENPGQLQVFEARLSSAAARSSAADAASMRWLFHGTLNESAQRIALNPVVGFRVSKVKRAACGFGLYFADTARMSASYARDGTMILAAVLVSRDSQRARPFVVIQARSARRMRARCRSRECNFMRVCVRAHLRVRVRLPAFSMCVCACACAFRVRMCEGGCARARTCACVQR